MILPQSFLAPAPPRRASGGGVWALCLAAAASLSAHAGPLEEGQAHLARGDLARARASLEQAAAAEATATATAHLELARCYLALHHGVLAAEQAALALQAPEGAGGLDEADRAAAVSVLVGALVQTTGADLAEETLLGVLRAEERQAAQAALAEAYAIAERYRDAQLLYDRLLAASPGAEGAAGWQAAVVSVAQRRGRLSEEVAARDVLARTYGPDSGWAQAHPDAAAALWAEQAAAERARLLRMGQDVLRMPPGAEATAAAREVSALSESWLARHPDDPEAAALRHGHAMVLLRLGRLEDAAAALEACWQAEPEGPLAAESLRRLAEIALRALQPSSGESARGGARQWKTRLLWAADTHAMHFGDEESAAQVQLLAAEGLLLSGEVGEALLRLEGVVMLWPEGEGGTRAALRVLEVHVARRDWVEARAAAVRYGAQAALTDPVLRARIDEVLQQTER